MNYAIKIIRQRCRIVKAINISNFDFPSLADQTSLNIIYCRDNNTEI